MYLLVLNLQSSDIPVDHIAENFKMIKRGGQNTCIQIGKRICLRSTTELSWKVEKYIPQRKHAT
jgi:hypothetical protein